MLNKSPVFLNSFARGGSNIVWEILQSHPGLASPVEETDKAIWMEAGKWKKFLNVWLSVRGGYPFPNLERANGYSILNYGVFHADNYRERKLNSFSKKYLDELLYRWKLKNIDHGFNKYKTKDEVYTLDELKQTRIAAKHVNGLIYLVPALIKTYPDSVHFGLVRNGLALCESRLRRGTFKEAGKFGVIYNKIVQKFFEYQEKYPNFHIIKFEDLLEDPQKFISNLYDKAGLPYTDEIIVRLKAKKFVSPDGSHATKFVEGDKYWINTNNFFDFISSEINESQISKMSKKDIDGFLKIAGPSMQKLGYLPGS